MRRQVIDGAVCYQRKQLSLDTFPYTSVRNCNTWESKMTESGERVDVKVVKSDQHAADPFVAAARTSDGTYGTLQIQDDGSVLFVPRDGEVRAKVVTSAASGRYSINKKNIAVLVIDQHKMPFGQYAPHSMDERPKYVLDRPYVWWSCFVGATDKCQYAVALREANAAAAEINDKLERGHDY
jgi:hypothetical protein